MEHKHDDGVRARRRGQLAGLGALLTGALLAPLMALAARPAAAELEYVVPDLPDGNMQIIDLPNFASWMARYDDGVQRVNETNLAAMYNEYGPDPSTGFDTTTALAVNDLPSEDALDVLRPSTNLTAVGDLDGNGKPEVYVRSGIGVFRSTNLDEGFKAIEWPRTDPTISRFGLVPAALTDHGTPIAMGVMDGGPNTAASLDRRGLWFVTDQGYVSMIFKPHSTATPQVASYQIPLAPGERVLDAFRPSVLDQDPTASGAVRSNSQIAVLRAAPFGSAGQTMLSYTDIGSNALDITQLQVRRHTSISQPVPWAVGSGKIRRDYGRVEIDNNDISGTGILVTKAGEAGTSWLATSEFDGPFCTSSDPARSTAFDLEVYDNNGSPVQHVSCAADAGVAGGKRTVKVDQVRMSFGGGNEVTSTSWTYPTNAPTGAPLKIKYTSLDTPCPWLGLMNGFGGGSCGANIRTATLVHSVDANNATRLDVFSRDPNTPAGSTSAENWNYGRVVSTKPVRDIVPLPQGRNRVRIQLDDYTRPVAREGRPIPMVVLAAPPYVRGAGQVPLAGPTYNVRTSSGSDRGESTSTSIGVSLGLEVDLGLVGVSASASYGQELGNDVEESIEATGSEQFVGSPVEDTVVYSAPTFWQYRGTIQESSNGLGIGSTTFLNLPRSNVITSATLSDLQRRYPAMFTGGENDKGILGRVITHDTGDPGTYTTWGSTNGVSVPMSSNVRSYCDDASFTDTGRTVDERGFYPHGISAINNPFIEEDLVVDPPFSGPGILNSELHTTQVGSDNSEGAGFSITNSVTRSRIADRYIGAEAGMTLGVVTAGAEWQHTWGQSWGSSFSDGVDFLGYVGHIPDPDNIFQNEKYDWRVFLCKKALGDAGGPGVWVLNYTVDGYNGSGGMDELGEITLGSPAQSEVAPLKPELTWSQDGGTVKDFDVQLEGVGTNDVRSSQLAGVLPNQTVAAAKAFAADGGLEDLRLALGSVSGFQDLKPNQLYRWRVTSRDFLRNTVTSDWEYFVTDGPPTGAGLTVSDPTVNVGTSVTFTATHSGGGTPTSYAFDLGDGRALVTQASPTYTSSYSAAGVFPVKVTMTNGNGSASATATVSVGPLAVGETYAATEDTTLTRTAAQGVKANDTGASFVVLSGHPQKGTVDLRGDGAFTYVPTADACGADTFSYAVFGGAFMRFATTTINVACVNDVPTAADISYSTPEDTDLVLESPGMLTFTTDPDVGDSATAVVTGGVEHGQLTSQPDGGFTYRPAANFCGDDAFRFQRKDGAGASSNVATISIKVGCVNDAPSVPALQQLTATEDQVAALVVDVGATDVETPAASLTSTVAQQPTRGTVTPGAAGTFEYRPNPNACGYDSFTYTVTDQALPTGQPAQTSSAGLVEIEVACVNDAPKTGAPAPIALDEDTTVTRTTATGFRSTASDVDDNDPVESLTFAGATGAAHGTATVNSDGSFSYSPTADYCGADSFTYTVSDGDAAPVGPATVSVTVACKPDAPRPAADQYVATDGQLLTFAAPGLLGNDVEVDGQAMRLQAGTFTTPGGTLVLNQNGSGTYRPRAGYSGTDTFTYTVLDSANSMATGQVSFVVRARTTLTAQRATISNGQGTVRARLVQAGDGAPVVGVPIAFVVQGRAFCTAITGADGRAQCTAPEPNGNVRLFGRYQAFFAGTPRHIVATSASTPFGVLALI